MIRKLGFGTAIVALVALIFLCQAGGNVLKEHFLRAEEVAGTISENPGEIVVVIDPGHGGIDAGKVGVNGAKEKDINLNIAKDIKTLLEKASIKVVMTRADDERLAEKQVEDLKARVEIMNRQKPVLVVSIHQNSYHEENVRGAQVFYYTDSKEGERAAAVIQEALKEVDPDNTKEAKANNSYYILKKTEVPVVIAECGFLSNHVEAEKLTDKDFQGEIAAAITNGILRYIEER